MILIKRAFLTDDFLLILYRVTSEWFAQIVTFNRASPGVYPLLSMTCVDSIYAYVGEKHASIGDDCRIIRGSD